MEIFSEIYMALDRFLSRFQKNSRWQKAGAILSIGLAIFTAVFAWGWWISHDRPNPVERPHSLMWDAISLHLRSTGHAAATGINHVDNNPLIRAAAWSVHILGESYFAVVLVQVPFLILLLLSTSLLAWRLSGPFAASIAPWIALLCPTTLGLSLHLDDLIALQALTCASLAIIAWADETKFKWTAIFAFVPILLGITCSVYSNGLLMLMVYGISAGSLVAMQWAGWRQSKVSKRLERAPWLPLIGAAIALIAGLSAAYPFSLDYISGEAVNPDYDNASVFSNIWLLFAYPLLWYKLLVAPRMALLAILFFGVLIGFRKYKDTLFLLAWLLIPMLLLTLFNKKHDWYILAAVPATFLAIALGISAIPKLRLRLPVFIATMLLLFGAWGAIDDSPDAEDMGMLYEAFYRYPKSYLVSPKIPKPDWADLGEKITTECGKLNLSIVFANGFGINGMESFFCWHANPSIPILDLRWGPTPETVSFCIAARFDPSVKEEPTITKLLYNYEKQARSKGFLRAEQKTRLNFVQKTTKGYAPLITHNNWTVFAPANLIPN